MTVSDLNQDIGKSLERAREEAEKSTSKEIGHKESAGGEGAPKDTMQEGRASEREGGTSRGSCLTSEESAQEGRAPKEHVGGEGSREGPQGEGWQ